MRLLTGPIALGGAFLALAAALLPLRHEVRVERSEGNPVQRVILESRSLLGLERSAWGACLDHPESWGSIRDGFFLAPGTPVDVELRAWPRFSRRLCLQPSGEAGLDRSPLGEGDKEAFRAWFVALLEQQLEGPSPAWEEAQRDCAGLLRFAFREAWGPHTEAWRDRVGFGASPAAGEPSPLLAGPWRRAFPTPEGWQPFAKGAFLRRFSCLELGRDPHLARPGDLVFFARGGAHPQPDHVMAFVRPDVDGCPVLLYHTGPEGRSRPSQVVAGRSPEARLVSPPGEVRRVRLDELLHHPDPEFRPLPENPAFLGVYRWIVLG